MCRSKRNELFYNASGAADPTAASAIRKIIGETIMTTMPKAGKVWVDKNGDTILILAVNGKIMTFTHLFYTGTKHTDVFVKGMHANSSMLFSTYADNACEFLAVTTDEEFAEVQKAFAKSLGLAGPSVTLDSSAKDSKIADLSKKCEKLTKDHEAQNDRIDKLSAKIVEQKKEIDMLNGIIDRMIDRMIERLAG